MESIFENLFDIYCSNDRFTCEKFSLDEKEEELYKKIESVLSKEFLEVFEKFYDVVIRISVEKQIKSFEQGVKVGIKLASGELKEINL